MVLGLHTKAGVEEIHIDRLSKAKTTIRHMLNHREFEFVRKLELNDVGSLFLRNSNWDKLSRGHKNAIRHNSVNMRMPVDEVAESLDARNHRRKCII